MAMFSAYRNQSTDLQCKSIDWFLYVGNIRMKRVKVMETNRQKAMSWLNNYTEKRRKNKDVSNIIKITTEYSLCESVRIRSFSGPYFPHIRTEYSVSYRSECGKIQTRKTPNTDNFHAVIARNGSWLIQKINFRRKK